MTGLILKLIKRWNLIRKIFVVTVLLILLSLFCIYLFTIYRMEGDAASHLLLAVSPLLKIGSPYKDFWEIKPPVWPLTVYIWSSLFGFRILSMRVISLIVAVLSILITRLVYKKVFQTPVFEVIFIFSTIVFLSPILYEFILPTEMLGFLFSIAALLILISIQKDFPKFYFSGLLFFAASQTKEPFTFTIFAVLPLLVGSFLHGGFSRLTKNGIQFLLGIFTGFIVIYFYLGYFGSIGSYLEVYEYKQKAFSFTVEKILQNFLPGYRATERTFTEFSSGFSLLLLLSIISFYFVNKFKKILFYNLRNSELSVKSFILSDSTKIFRYSVFLYAIGSFFGFGIGGSFGHHYLIQVVVPFYIIYGFIVSYLFSNVSFMFKKSKKYFYLTLLLFIFSVIIIMPKRQYLYSYKPETGNSILVGEVLGFEKRMTELTTPNQCVLSVYGWGASSNYLYSKRRPCTRFFLVNIVREDWQKKEYYRDIITNPPAVIYYRTNASDMNTLQFESEVININKIIENCYTKDIVEEVLFIPKTNDIEQLKKCISASGI